MLLFSLILVYIVNTEQKMTELVCNYYHMTTKLKTIQ